MSRSVSIAVNRYAFHWAYPEIAADELGLFRKQGIQILWHDATPPRVADKSALYRDLLTERKTDVYHAGEWACINRVLSSPDSWIVAKSIPGKGTLNSTFSLFVRPESKIRKPSDLANRAVGIESGTGSYYTALLDLERWLPRQRVKLVQFGEPHKRLLAVLAADVDCASLVGPWADIGEALGLRRILRTCRSNPTTIVVRRDMERGLLRDFFVAVNGAIGMINAHPERFRRSYYERVASILAEMPYGVWDFRHDLRRDVTVSKWKPWEAYAAADFRSAYRWLLVRGLVEPGHKSAEVIAPYSRSLFP